MVVSSRAGDIVCSALELIWAVVPICIVATITRIQGRSPSEVIPRPSDDSFAGKVHSETVADKRRSLNYPVPLIHAHSKANFASRGSIFTE